MRLGDRGVLSPDTEALAGELVAFANGAGGGVFLGVADSGAVAGIPPSRVDAVERWRPYLQPQQAARHHHARRDALPAAHAQPDPGKLSVQNLEQAWAMAALAVN